MHGAVQNHGHDKSQPNRYRHRQQEDQGIFDRDIKHFVRKHPADIGQSDEPGVRVHELVIRKHQVKRINRRQNKKQQHADHVRPDKDVSQQLLSFHPGCFHMAPLLLVLKVKLRLQHSRGRRAV